jgi:hemoglobin
MRIRSILAAFAISAVVACGGGGKKEDTMAGGGGGGGEMTAPTESLYTRLGGKESIAKVVDLFVANVAADVRINAFFARLDATGISELKRHLTDQICEAASAGVECKYTGKSMKEVHAGMGVKQEHFDALVEDLVKALDTAGVGQREKDELLGALAPMAPDIVEN